MRKRLAALALGVLALSVGAPAAALAAQPTLPQVQPAPATLPRAASCSGVWMVVDFGSLGGGVVTRCATSYSDGVAALRSANFNPNVDEGFVYKISGKPSKPNINKAYWSYWHAKADGKGGYSAWTYSNLGAASYHPKKGDAEGWRFVLISDPRTPPQAAPPKNSAESPKPRPTKTAPKPKPKPTKGGVADKPSAKPTASKPRSTRAASTNPTATASKATSKRPTKKASSTATAGGSATAAGTTTMAGTPSEGDQSAVAQEQPGTADGSAPGSPVGAIVTGAVIVAAAGGLGGWWLLKGRKP